MTNPLHNIHPKYILTTASKVDRPHSYVHAIIQGKMATIIDAEVGQRGWITYYDEDDMTWHRIHTSPIQNITLDGNGNICIETENTLYNLTKIKEV